MIDILILIGMILLEWLIIRLAIKDPKLLRAVIILNMALISLFAGKLASYFGYINNVGNIWYATVFLSQALIVKHLGLKEAIKTINVVFISMVFLFLTVQGLALLPDYGSPIYDNIIELAEIQRSVALASFLAFYLVQALFSWILTKGHSVTQKIKATWLCQGLDSLIFFPIAFGNILPPETIITLIISGWLIKSIIGTIDSFVFKKYL